MAVGSAGGATMGTLVAAQQFANGIKVIYDAEAGAAVIDSRTQLIGITDDLKLLKSAQGLRAVAGAGVIQVLGIILSSIAIEQFVAIETARPKLEASLTMARQPVDLDVLDDADSGEDMLYVYWSKAMDVWDAEDSQVLQLAASARLRAEQSDYAAPAKIPQSVTLNSTVDRLSSGTSSGFLEQGKKLVSANRKYEAEMQTDGNFVIYAPNRVPIWSTRTNGRGSAPYKLAVQADSNLVIYAGTAATWASGVHKRTAPYTLIMQDDGNLVMVDKSQVVVWQTNTKR
jgi:hypothetical protein